MSAFCHFSQQLLLYSSHNIYFFFSFFFKFSRLIFISTIRDQIEGSREKFKLSEANELKLRAVLVPDGFPVGLK